MFTIFSVSFEVESGLVLFNPEVSVDSYNCSERQIFHATVIRAVQRLLRFISNNSRNILTLHYCNCLQWRLAHSFSINKTINFHLLYSILHITFKLIFINHLTLYFFTPRWLTTLYELTQLPNSLQELSSDTIYLQISTDPRIDF